MLRVRLKLKLRTEVLTRKLIGRMLRTSDGVITKRRHGFNSRRDPQENNGPVA